MSTRIESTVAQLPEELAKSGVSGDQVVMVTVLDTEEANELAELRQLIDEGLHSGDDIDGDVVFDELRQELIAKYPHAAPQV